MSDIVPNTAIGPQDAPELTRAELIACLPELGMTSDMRLEITDPEGTVHPGAVRYSSDLKAMAIHQYDGQGNITSWYPLPTRTTNYFPGITSTSVAHQENNGEGTNGYTYRVVG